MLIGAGDVRDSDVEKARGVIRIRWGLECDCRFVVGWSAADADGDPAARERDD
jgi:hypothetical protein